MSLEYELNTMRKTIERRLMFLEMTLTKINVSIQNLEVEVRNKNNYDSLLKSAIMTYHGADPQTGRVKTE